MTKDIEHYERQLRKEGLLPPSILDEISAAGKA
jgi:hypothetical protein